MLILVYANECPSSWYEFNFTGKKQMCCMFGIVDTVRKYFYYYTAYDIENKFLKKSKQVNGIQSKNNKITNFEIQCYDDISFLIQANGSLLYMGSLYKIILGKNVSLRNMRFKYDNCIVYRTDGMLTVTDLGIPLLRNNLVGKKRTLMINKKEDKYSVERHVNLSFYFYRDTSSFDKTILKKFNEFAKVNIVNNYTSMFSNLFESELDISDLYCADVLSMHRMFSSCEELEYLKFCKLDLNFPITLSNMFLDCCNLETIDFSLLRNDLPKELINIDYIKKVDLTCMLNVGLDIDNFKKYCIFVLPQSAPIFNEYFILSNKLKFLGNINKGKDMKKQLEFFRSKLILKGVLPNENAYYVLIK